MSPQVQDFATCCSSARSCSSSLLNSQRRCPAGTSFSLRATGNRGAEIDSQPETWLRTYPCEPSSSRWPFVWIQGLMSRQVRTWPKPCIPGGRFRLQPGIELCQDEWAGGLTQGLDVIEDPAQNSNPLSSLNPASGQVGAIPSAALTAVIIPDLRIKHSKNHGRMETSTATVPTPDQLAREAVPLAWPESDRKVVREGERAERSAVETALRGKFKAPSWDDDSLYQLLGAL